MTSAGRPRSYSSPIIIRRDADPTVLGRLPFDAFDTGQVRYLDEEKLQDLIFRNPAMLPIQDIEASFAPAIPLATEVSVGVGSVDILFISPGGYLTIVETKLWRNPQARREVLGQVVDYARALSAWSTERLTEVLRKQLPGLSQCGLWEYIQERANERGANVPSEAAFYGALEQNLSRGRFLLLIAGDGIRENVEAMAEFLNRTPQLHFTLALIELEVYELDTTSLLVVPHVLARTREVTRAVVRLDGSPTGVTIGPADEGREVTVAPPARSHTKGRTLTEQDFLNALRAQSDGHATAAEVLLGVLNGMGVTLSYGTASVVAKLADPAGSAKPLTLFVLYTDGTMQFGWMPDQLASMGRPRSPAEQFYAGVVNLFGVRASKVGNPMDLTVQEVGAKVSEFVALVEAFTRSIAATNPEREIVT